MSPKSFRGNEDSRDTRQITTGMETQGAHRLLLLLRQAGEGELRVGRLRGLLAVERPLSVIRLFDALETLVLCNTSRTRQSAPRARRDFCHKNNPI